MSGRRECGVGDRRRASGVVLLDIQLADVDGFGVMARLDPPPAGPAVVLVSTREATDYGGRVARSGAAGFITKAELSVAAVAEAVGP